MCECPEDRPRNVYDKDNGPYRRNDEEVDREGILSRIFSGEGPAEQIGVTYQVLRLRVSRFSRFHCDNSQSRSPGCIVPRSDSGATKSK